MDPLLVFPDPPVALARALEVGGWDFTTVDSAGAERHARPDAGWGAAVVLVVEAARDEAIDFATGFRSEQPDTPILLVTPEACVAELANRADAFDDFCVLPVRPDELTLRLGRLIRTTDGDDEAGDLIVYGPLMINPVTYQAVIDGQPLDLTYMEYELLKYFAERPGRVCTREVLLGQVWGYEYYGGARTVDVHVRRLRAKLGEPHAGLIGTVRSVGYRFGRSQWG